MADLKLLTERVIEREKSAVQEEISEAQAKAEKDVEAARQNAEAEKENRKKQIDARLKQEHNISLNTLDVQKRDQVLAVKQRILSDVFADAHEKLKNLDSKTTQRFLENVLSQFPNQGQVEVVLGERSKDKVDASWLESVKVKGTTVTASEETVANAAGALIRKEGIEYNFLFDALIEDSKNELILTVSQQLFQ